jgi:hypothetical protein
MIHDLPPTPVPPEGPVDTSPIALTPADAGDLDPIWKSVVPETRTRSNDIHLPISLAYAERLCAAHPHANALLVRVAILLHDIGWGRVDESRILSEGFSGDWRKAAIRFEHERQGCIVARAAIAPEVDERNRHFKVEVRVSNEGRALLSGMYATARIVEAATADAVLVPKAAVTTKDGKRVVQKVTGDTVTAVEVLEGLSDGQRVQIKTGLSAGDVVLADARRPLAAGAKVRGIEAR